MNDRYLRQVLVDQIGSEGQQRLSESSVVVVGTGGLGSPALTYLAAAGIGYLGFIDADTVEPSNLNRQFLHNEDDISRYKTKSAKEKLAALNSDIKIYEYTGILNEQNAESLLFGYDIVIGAVDSFETRSVINKACASLNIPYIDGGVKGFSGSIIYSHPPKSPCLNCVFPTKNANKSIMGVLGTTAGVVGTALANIALLILLGLENPIKNKLFLYDGLRMNTNLIDIYKDENCPVCSLNTSIHPGAIKQQEETF
ncbi:MAG: HesA/MoeB/ThiF family protein [Defluviitaleaceae bacterium]|nr:HesA/MoeB/ThiF family protein [Defluviitaleaceae bacterium]